MADCLQTAAAWLVDQLAANASQSITYRRGAKSTATTIAATKCPVRSEQDTEFGILRIGSCDWIIKASLLVIDGATIEPQKNDVIEESDGQKWMVLADQGEDHYRPFDPHRTAFRIHTKRIDEG